MNTRLSYIDIAKGLLILMVVFLHVGYYPTSVWGGVNRAFELGMNTIGYLFIPFFMAAFFILSGFCSDAGKKRSVEETIKKGIIKLLVPMILLKFDHDQWFCWAMFFALIFDCLIELIKNKFWRIVVLVVLPVVATFCNSRGWDYTYLDYAMVFTPFLYIGRHFKQIVSNNKVGVVCTIVYLHSWLVSLVQRTGSENIRECISYDCMATSCFIHPFYVRYLCIDACVPLDSEQ